MTMKTHSWQFNSYGNPSDVLEWREQTLPDPKAGQAIVRLRAIGLNSADKNYVQGHYFPTQEFPSCLGSEAVGEVIALGPPLLDDDQAPGMVDALELKVGMRVGMLCARVDRLNMGVFREVGLYDQSALVPIPDSYSDQEGAALWMGVLTMAGAMEMGGLNQSNAANKKVLFTAGASGMGVIGLKLAKHWGAQTIATTRDANKVEPLKRLADHVIVCDNSAALEDAVKQATDMQGADLIVDPVGAMLYPGLLESCANGGDIVSYEMITGTEASVDIFKLMLKDVSIHGYTIFRPFSDPALLNQLVNLGLSAAEVLRPIIDRSYSLLDAPEALNALVRSEHVGKIVLTV